MRDFVYSAVAGTTSTGTTGLGITNAAGFHPLHSTVSSYGSSGDIPYAQNVYNDAGNFGKGQAMLQSGLPPTPQTAGLPPDPQPRRSTPSLRRSSSVRPVQGPKRLRPKATVDDNGQPAIKRRRSSTASQTSVQTQQQIASLEQQAERQSQSEKLEEEQFFAELRQQGVSWKEIAKRHEAKYGKKQSEAALQMKRKRLRDSLRTWTDADVSRSEF